MEQGVAEDESVLGAPVAPSQKKVTCATCGSGFSKQANLTRHVEAKHTDQTTPEAVAKRLELGVYRKANSRERRANDRVYREKMQQVSATNRVEKKARLAIAAGGARALPASEAAPAEEAKADADASSVSINEPARALPAAPRVFRVTTTALTTANVTGFFSPKYPAPRSKEQRLAAPRSSAI
jgi:hypothetical protein